MWKRIKVLCKSFKDFVASLFQNAFNNIKKAMTALGWAIVPVAALSFYILMALPQLAVFAVIASFTNGIQDPVLKFVAGLLVLAAAEYVLLTVAWWAIVILGLPELLRFSAYIHDSYEKRLAEEELREIEGRDITLADTYARLKDHEIQPSKA